MVVVMQGGGDGCRDRWREIEVGRSVIPRQEKGGGANHAQWKNEGGGRGRSRQITDNLTHIRHYVMIMVMIMDIHCQ